MKDSFSINTRRYAMRKRKWMKAGACALSAVLIMGLYAGPAFAEWIGTGGVRAYIINGQVQTGWQQIDGKWYYLNEQGAHCYCNEGEDSKFMADFIPCKNQEWNINSIKSQ